MTDALAKLSARLAILPDYVDLSGQSHETGRETQVALLAAMGVDATTAASARESLAALNAEETSGRHPDWQVVTVNTAPRLEIGDHQHWQIDLEDGGMIEGRGAGSLPALPLGRHLLTGDSRKTWLLAAPDALPRPPRAWGVTVPLAGLRGPDEGGIGDFENLGDAAIQLARKGAAFLGINPVHAGFPTDETAFSPYSPSHRLWLNTMHIATGADPAATGPLINYPVETLRQRNELRAWYDAGEIPESFEAYQTEMGDALTRFATHQALSESYGPYWINWPAELRRAHSPEVQREAEGLVADIRFHAWAQFQGKSQLSCVADRLDTVGMHFGLLLDLAVGTHPFGAETWENPALYAKGAALGVPPDAFSPDGQNWTLAPMVPRAMQAEGLATFAAILRRQFQFAKLLRIDHILGFDRAFWLSGHPGLPGAYVKMPREAMLAVTRIEAARANASVIGEDLGNIPAGLQSSLRRSGLLGSRLIVFEHDVGGGAGFKPPQEYDTQTLTSFSTHDLPTWAGWRTGADIRARRRVGHISDAGQSTALAQRSAEVGAFDTVAGARGVHGFLADSAAQLVAVQIENVFELKDQPNLPGTIDQYPNWRQRLPVAVPDYATDSRLDRVSNTMNSSGRGKTYDRDRDSDIYN